MLWFYNRGIRKSEPEELINKHKALLKVRTGQEVRKMSAPNEGSFLLQRRTKDAIKIYV